MNTDATSSLLLDALAKVNTPPKRPEVMQGVYDGLCDSLQYVLRDVFEPVYLDEMNIQQSSQGGGFVLSAQLVFLPEIERGEFGAVNHLRIRIHRTVPYELDGMMIGIMKFCEAGLHTHMEDCRDKSADPEPDPTISDSPANFLTKRNHLK